MAFSRRGRVKESECGNGSTEESFVSFQSQTEEEMMRLIRFIHPESELIIIDGTFSKDEIVQVILNSIQ